MRSQTAMKAIRSNDKFPTLHTCTIFIKKTDRSKLIYVFLFGRLHILKSVLRWSHIMLFHKSPLKCA